ncbi:MAG: HAD-IIA family hydrolase [Armatimonadota bacterium]|nr:HAD-IIA family hydrolase [Armatimonadota bacterium]
MPMVTRIAGFLFDMDGVLYRGRRPLPGARALLADLDRRAVPFALVTNNSARTPRQYARHLAAMGMHVPESRIITSSQAAAAYLRRALRPGARVLVIGEWGLRQAVRQAGFVVAWDRVAAVVVGLDRTLNFRKLTRATEALLRGALFVAANPDPLIPTEQGVLPGAGVPVEALAYAVGRRPTVLGKPEPHLLLEGMARIGTTPPETVMVGDQLSTDIAAGHAAGTLTVHVQTGVSTTRPAPGNAPRADLVVRDLRELRRWAAGRLPAAHRLARLNRATPGLSAVR